MLECVGSVRRYAAAEDELRSRQALESLIQLLASDGGDRVQQMMLKRPADDRANLRRLLRGPKPVQPCKKRALDRGRNRCGLAAFQERTRQFLDEKWASFSLYYDFVQRFIGKLS